MTNNKQQTAVEWLENEIFELKKLRMLKFIDLAIYVKELDIAFNKAKEMENKRMIEFGVMLTEDEEDAIEAIYHQTYGGGEQ